MDHDDLERIVQEADFPRHKAMLTLTHNEHKNEYQTVEQWLQNLMSGETWVSLEQKAQALATDSVWELRWYADTPIGFHHLLSCDLAPLLEAARQADATTTVGTYK